jgi:hypothetical protein
MAFVNRVLLIIPSFGTPLQNDALFLKTASVATLTTTTTSLTGLTPAIKEGWIRIKLSASTGAGTVTSLAITLTDGTTTESTWTETLVGTANSFQSPNQVVRTVPFLSELAVTQVNVITVFGTAGGTLDIEVGASN